MGETPCDQLAAGDPLDFSPSAAASAAGGRGIDGSRRVHSLGVRGVPAGGAVEVAARPERLLVAVVLSSVLGAPVEALGRSTVTGAAVVPRSCGVPSLELAAVVAALVLDLGVRQPPLRWMVVLLLNFSGSLQASCSPSSAVAVGAVEDGWRRRVRLRREMATAIWRWLDADAPSAFRFWRLRQMDPAASQQGWSSWLLRCEVSSRSSSPAACCWCSKLLGCSVVPCLLCVGCFLPLFVRVCSFIC